jgi:uncharacterized OB-fold protein
MSGPRSWPGEIPVTSLYTAGTAGQAFFEALKNRGEILATRCDACQQTYVPARAFCERCFAELKKQVVVGPGGSIRSVAGASVDRDGQALAKPEVWALVQLDGATTVLLHRLLGVRDASTVKIGEKVEAVVKPKAQRSGSILDIAGFRVVAQSTRGSRALKGRRDPGRGTRRG